MKDLNFQQMLEMQRKLWEKNKDNWSPMEAQHARSQFLWMIGEIGEALDIIKKCGEDRIMNNNDIKSAFTEELCDVLMYFNNILLRYQISPEDLAAAYANKHNKNMNRDYIAKNKDFANSL
ncbi:MAG: nucleotide pyrophosphohydrolase [Defluviitaleaceae bacterium]|nr:nucleotide pyrophosphohydrolase [Defluviitaleaceae bacterium]